MSRPSELIVAGQTIQLGRSVGRGGEGEVFALGDKSGRAVKVYNEAKRQSRERKVMAMVRARLANKSQFVAYPIEVARYRNGKFAGFVMTFVNGYKPLFELYSPGARKTSFPKADYRFLVRAASNVARAVASVHKSGCVIGDINHSGILVSSKATVTLIDADSFQVIHDNSRYLCRVGVPEYTPPELHGIDLGSIVRTQNHDAFGLAVVVFQLLFMGRHPFVGTVRKGDVPKIDVAIRDFRFVYAENRNVGMDQPPGTPALSDFTPSIARAFEQAFAKESLANRPSAAVWAKCLEELERSLTHCRNNKLHFFPTDASDCPWCEMDQQLGMALFVPHFDSGAPEIIPQDPGDATFNLAAVWRQIEAVKAPPASALRPKLQVRASSPSEEALSAKSGSGADRFKGFLGIVGAAGIALTIPAAWFFYVPLGWWGLVRLFGEPNIPRQPFIEKATEAETQWQKAYAGWKQRCGIQQLQDLQLDLDSAKTKYGRLADEENSRIADYKKRRREIQLIRYLDGFQIHRATIRGIGPAKEATLASFGIETAADISRHKVLRVPGFGPVTTKPLLDWRRSKENRFVYDPKPNALDRQEIGQIRTDIADQRAQARKLLLAGSSQRRKLLRKIKSTTNVVDSRLNAIHARREQTHVDLNYLGIPLPKVTPQRSGKPSYSPSKTPSTPRPTARPSPTQSQTPSCPRCNSQMVMRVARRGRYAGNSFWGCSRYPRCKGIRNI